MSVRAAETRSFVLSYFYPANYYGEDTCPDGLNPLADVFLKRDLKILGLPQAEVNAMFDKDYKIQNGDPTTRWVAVVATRGNGRDNVYLHPTTVPDAHLKPAAARFAYGFNLDGKGAASPNSYEDPRPARRASTTSFSGRSAASRLTRAIRPRSRRSRPSTAGTTRAR
jgi:hypothetical protein